jgi:hypothetical protein
MIFRNLFLSTVSKNFFFRSFKALFPFITARSRLRGVPVFQHTPTPLKHRPSDLEGDQNRGILKKKRGENKFCKDLWLEKGSAKIIIARILIFEGLK